MVKKGKLSFVFDRGFHCLEGLPGVMKNKGR